MLDQPRLHYVHCAVAGNTDEGRRNGTHRMAYWEWNHTGNPQHPHVIVCVHGLTRQGRDFDALARQLAPHARVICPDVVGRGYSDWLDNPQGYQVPLYVADMLALLQQVHQTAPIGSLDWVGTSMGGLIGIGLAGEKSIQSTLPVPVRRLVLNDVGPVIEPASLARIGSYVGKNMVYASEAQAVEALWQLSTGFGPHTPEEWLALSRPMLRPESGSSVRLHYDPAIGIPMQAMTPEMALAGEQLLWQLYDNITADTLVLRGAESDLLSAQTAQSMAQCGPQAHVVEFAGVGHAPTLVSLDQIAAVLAFLCGA
ncbi:alpha/beta fold hydrolase [Comamonas sp. J-3]|uniref:alpha/beta fold hydrolase n=1 Tax=Comamonas trifloxystrobinivorans TaxID=3350256 RepID=UPI00372BFEEC